MFEATDQPLYMMFLDWTMAFDKVSHAGLHIALKRFGIPDEYIEAIDDIYTHATFQVKEEQYMSSTKTQTSGIRQGCPLSPYLFIIFLSVLMHDAREDASEKLNHTRPHLYSFNDDIADLEYADDIVLFSRTRAHLQQMLHSLQHEAQYYGMLLNRDKTKTLLLHPTSPDPFTFFDHTPEQPQTVKQATSITYLGILIQSSAHTRPHINQKLSFARKDFNKLIRLWQHTNINTKFKLKIFSAIFPPQILYCLHHTWQIESVQTQLDSWQTKQLRRVLKWKSAYYSHNAGTHLTNDKVYQVTHHKPFSTQVADAQVQYYAHITRHPDESIYTVCFGPGLAERAINAKRRVGRPRHHWLPNVEPILYQRAASLQPTRKLPGNISLQGPK